MAKKKRQRISYVLPLASTPGGHRLGVNGLAYDQERAILYTGGRDGVICAWDINVEAQNEPVDPKDAAARKSHTFRKQVQAHTHWVNDIVLVKNDLGLVSVSSDVTVKLWRPHAHEPNAAQTIGSHSDYIKVLTTPDRNANWVASGGLDHRICLWDLSGGGKTLEIKAEDVVKGSVYALRARGSILASGGPESVVRLWDVKSGKAITKLVGHTDNIRDILISDDEDTLLSASSDQTIKVWSIREGRCLHTLTMHNDSVWCMYSEDPSLAVFYSGDKSGLVAKTDTRRAMEIDEGVSVAVCQEHDGIARLARTGKSIWTATSSSSINRWRDADTELEVETPPSSPRVERIEGQIAKTVDGESDSEELDSKSNGATNGTSHDKRIPHNAVLRLSNTALHPGRKVADRYRNQSVTNLRKASEAILEEHLHFIVPIRGHPDETVEGQNGLIKHVMLNDRRRVLTLDTAGEVVLWDLMRCVPIKSFGRRHLDEVVPGVNTTESVANWCAVDTKTGKLTVMLEENYAFDAEVYADELDMDETKRVEFREDQRVNLGRWVLRNLFTSLLDEEIRRDEDFRKSLRSQKTGIKRSNAPLSITLPDSTLTSPMVSPDAATTPKPTNGLPKHPTTPGMNIGLATPGRPLFSGNMDSPATLSPTTEASPALEKHVSSLSGMQETAEPSRDYFSPSSNTQDEVSESNKNGVQPAQPSTPGGTQIPVTISNPTSPTEEKKKSGLWGKKFQMKFPTKLNRVSAEVKAPAAEVEKADTESTKSSEKEEKVIENNFFGVVQKIRQDYEDYIEAKPDEPLPMGLVPSLPIETPVLKPPPHTLIIIQEDDPASGGLLDQYRGEISQLGKEADTLEKIAPTWLGDFLLKNQIPYKDTVKVSFILQPYQDLLPSIAAPDGNARLNANRMLRAKKIIAYVAERVEAPPNPHPGQPAQIVTSETEEAPQPSEPAKEEEKIDKDLKPEDYLDLICQGQKVDPNTTLATLRVHVWRTGGDVVLYYKANGRKALKRPHPADVPGRDEGAGAEVAGS